MDIHRARHYDKQRPTAAAYRRVLEQVAAENGAGDQSNVLVPAAFFQVVMSKSLQALTAEGAEVGVGEGIAAGRELAKLLAAGDDTQRWAEAHAKMNRIVACFREFVPADRQAEMLARLEGRQLAVIDGGLATDTEYVDPFGDDSEDEDDEDDD